jgi:hypothetical protein
MNYVLFENMCRNLRFFCNFFWKWFLRMGNPRLYQGRILGGDRGSGGVFMAVYGRVNKILRSRFFVAADTSAII